jgi:hypothetical protein
MYTQIEIDPVKLNRILKNLKANSMLFMKKQNQVLKIRNIDFKEFLGVIDIQIPLNQNTESNFAFSIAQNVLVSYLDNFKSTVLLKVVSENSYIILRSKDALETTQEYNIPCEVSARVDKIMSLQIINAVELSSPCVTFKTKTNMLYEILKAATAVDYNISFKFTAIDSKKRLLLFTKKTDTIFQDVLEDSDKILNLNICSENNIYEAELYFYSPVFLNVLKNLNLYELNDVNFYDDYLCIRPFYTEKKDYDIILYFPLKRTKCIT